MTELHVVQSVPDLAPACFGSSTAHNATAKECASCPFCEGCGIKAANTRAMIRKELGLDDVAPKKAAPRCPVATPPSRTPKPPKIETPKAPIMKIDGDLPKKSIAMLESIARTGIDLLTELKAGRNPGVGVKPIYLEPLCAVILAGDFSKEELRLALNKARGWDNSTGSAHVSFIIPALKYLKVITENEGRFALAV